MKCSPRLPNRFTRNASAISDALAVNRRGYTPEWHTPRGVGDAGMALNEIFARYLEIQGEGLNAMPQRLQLEFLESLGANVLPPQPARAPLVFKLLETASDDATVPLGTRVAAVLPPAAPSLEHSTVAKQVPPPEFFTEQEMTAMRGKLAVVYSIDPLSDRYADHTADISTGFYIFRSQEPVPHRLYLGHGELLKLTGSAEIVLSFDFATPDSLDAMRVRRPLLLDWEYLSVDGWLPLIVVEDGTRRFTRDGKVTLTKLFGPDSKEDVVGGHSSYWIRGTVSNRTPQARLSTEPSGYLIRFTPASLSPTLNVGDQVRIATEASTSLVLAVSEGKVLVSAPLRAAETDAVLQNAAGVAIGTITSAPPYFRLPVENIRELLPGDVITIDGNQRATIALTDDSALYLDSAIDGVQPGLMAELADALPPLRPDGLDQEGVLPQVDVIRARVGFGQDDLPPDNAYLDGFRIDISKDFAPFGEQPTRFAAFYLSCKDAFSRRGARIDLNWTFTQVGNDEKNASVQAEYFNGQWWVALGANEEYTDTSNSFTQGESTGGNIGLPTGRISFVAPTNWVPYELNGDRQLWLRLRLADGDYGQPMSVSVLPDIDPSKVIVSAKASDLKHPIISRLAITFRYFTNPQPLEFCVTENDFVYVERSEDARWSRSPFAPFTPVLDRAPALHFGFSSKPPSALISLLVQVLEPAMEGDPQPFVWDYWGARGWTELSLRDATAGLKQTDLIQFVGPPDALPRQGAGGALYRIRARLKSGLASQSQIVRIGGIWLNAVWARQGQSVNRDGLGISNGNPDQSFALPMVRAVKAQLGLDEGMVAGSLADFERALDTPLAGVPILNDERVEVREWSGHGDDWQTVLGDVDRTDIRFEFDPQDPTIPTAAWVRWKAVPHFYLSKSNDRHYVVERARGIFRFPDADGLIPPAGAPIVVSYVTGGGTDGNVPAGAVRELRSGVGFVQSVANPVAAAGGAAAELLRATRDRSAQSMRHRARAVSFEDYEWIAMSASSEVARARALPLDGPAGCGSRGFVGVVVVPHSPELQPMPSSELCRKVISHLTKCVPAGIAGGIRIVTPSYMPVGVRAEVLPCVAEEAGRVEARVRTRLTTFLHPLTGGHDGHGWEFGESVCLSDLARLIENTPGVDAVRFLQLIVGQSLFMDTVPMESQQLIAAGNSQLKIIVPSVPYAFA